MAGLTVDLGHIKDQARGFADLAANLRDRVAVRAMSTLKTRIGPELNRQFSSVLNLPARQISQRVTVTKGDDFVEVTASGKRIPLAQFGGKYSGHSSAGATAQVYRDAGRKTYVSAFTTKTGGAILARQLQGSKRAPRYPLKPLFGPDLGSVLVDTGSHNIIDPLNEFARNTLSAEVQRLVQVELENV